MKKKLFLLAAISAIFVGCSSSNTQPETTGYVSGNLDDPYKIMEAKREYYANLEKQKMAEAKEATNQKMTDAKNAMHDAVDGVKAEADKVEKVTKESMDELLKIMEKKRKGL